MGVLPLQFPEGESVESLGLTGEETFDLGDIENGEAKEIEVTATPEGGDPVKFAAKVRIDTPERGRLLPERRHPPPGAAGPAATASAQADARSPGAPLVAGRSESNGVAGPREAGGPRGPRHACASVAREGFPTRSFPEAGLARERAF